MDIKVENTENKNEVKLNFEIEAEKFEEAMKKVYLKNAKYFNIPGFRKGKAPMNIVEKYYGAQIFYEDAFNELVPEIYDEAIKSNNVEAVSRPNIDIKQMEKGKELIFTATVQTKPEVKLGKYKGIEIKKIEYNVSDKDIEQELNLMAEKNSRLITIEDRPVQKDDIAVIDFEGFLNGEPFEGGKAENHELTIGSNTFIPGFEDQVVGMKIGEEKDLNLKFPNEYFSKDLAGKDVVFKVKLNEIKKKELPNIDDEFAKDVSEFDTLKELKNSISEKLENQNKERERVEKEDAVIEAVSEKVEVDIPSGMIETEIDNMMKDIEQRLMYQGLTLKQYTELTGKKESDLRKEFEEQANKNVKYRLVLEAIVKAENIEVDDKSVEEKLKEMAKNYGQKEEELLNNDNIKQYTKENMKVEKAIEFLVENAKMK